MVQNKKRNVKIGVNKLGGYVFSEKRFANSLMYLIDEDNRVVKKYLAGEHLLSCTPVMVKRVVLLARRRVQCYEYLLQSFERSSTYVSGKKYPFSLKWFHKDLEYLLVSDRAFIESSGLGYVPFHYTPVMIRAAIRRARRRVQCYSYLFNPMFL